MSEKPKELEPCPFCGSQEVHIGRCGTEYVFVVCDKCRCDGPWISTKPEDHCSRATENNYFLRKRAFKEFEKRSEKRRKEAEEWINQKRRW